MIKHKRLVKVVGGRYCKTGERAVPRVSMYTPVYRDGLLLDYAECCLHQSVYLFVEWLLDAIRVKSIRKHHRRQTVIITPNVEHRFR